MEFGQLYSMVLIVMLVALITGVSVLILDKFSTTSGVTVTAQTAINAGRDAVTTINTQWLSIIILIAVMAVIIGLILSAFAYKMGGR